MNYKFKLKRDRIDYRDKLFLFEIQKEAIKLPEVVNLREKTEKVIYDQGSLGSCTAQAIASAINFLHDDYYPSRLFIYYIERMLEGTINFDSGASLRDGIKQVAKLGTCEEKLWPYDIEKFDIRPKSICFKEAKKDLITKYYRLNNTRTEMKKCLALGFPFVCGIMVYQSFMNAEKGLIPFPDPDSEELLGGHAILIVGYDALNKYYICKNSWGENWGDHGFFYLPFEYLESKSLTGDLWTVRRFIDG